MIKELSEEGDGISVLDRLGIKPILPEGYETYIRYGLTKEQILEKEKKGLQERLAKIDANIRATGLDHDSYNNFITLAYANDTNIEKIKPRLSYQEYVSSVHLVYPQVGGYILKISEPRKVAEYNELVEAFNAELDTIKKERDVKKVNDYLVKAEKLIKG